MIKDVFIFFGCDECLVVVNVGLMVNVEVNEWIVIIGEFGFGKLFLLKVMVSVVELIFGLVLVDG